MSLIKSSFSNWPVWSDFFDDNGARVKFPESNWSPAINVVDNEGSYEIEVAAPGLKKEDFSVSVENRVLTISGKSQKEEEEETKNYTRKEFSSRSFMKSFTLPENVMEEDIEAKHEDGVLHIMLQKSAQTLPPKKEVSIG